MVRTIDFGRFLQTVGYSHKRCPHNNQVKRADRKWNNGRPQRIKQANTLHYQVERNKSTAEKHRKYDEEHQQIIPHHVFS
ncbi:hypothetical protein D3C77_321460 [compost metagenome]